MTYHSRSLRLIKLETDPVKLQRKLDGFSKAERACRRDARDTARTSDQRAASWAIAAEWRLKRITAAVRLGELTQGQCCQCGQRLPTTPP
jgi:hypothetical protein